LETQSTNHDGGQGHDDSGGGEDFIAVLKAGLSSLRSVMASETRRYRRKMKNATTSSQRSQWSDRYLIPLEHNSRLQKTASVQDVIEDFYDVDERSDEDMNLQKSIGSKKSSSLCHGILFSEFRR
jgi:hypothetical protein